jgi:hypothetical protein
MASLLKQTADFNKLLDNLEEKISCDLTYIEKLKKEFYMIDKESIYFVLNQSISSYLTMKNQALKKSKKNLKLKRN